LEVAIGAGGLDRLARGERVDQLALEEQRDAQVVIEPALAREQDRLVETIAGGREVLRLHRRLALVVQAFGALGVGGPGGRRTGDQREQTRGETQAKRGHLAPSVRTLRRIPRGATRIGLPPPVTIYASGLRLECAVEDAARGGVRLHPPALGVAEH